MGGASLMEVAPIVIRAGEATRERGKDFTLPSDAKMEEEIGV
jgi:hypothetical protein